MIIVDSVGWVAYFKGDPLAPFYRPLILNTRELLCPTIVVYEVTKWIENKIDRQTAAIAAAQMLKALVIPLDAELAIAASQISLEHKLSLADAIIYTTAITDDATLVTSDAHFQGLPGVRFIPHIT